MFLPDGARWVTTDSTAHRRSSDVAKGKSAFEPTNHQSFLHSVPRRAFWKAPHTSWKPAGCRTDVASIRHSRAHCRLPPHGGASRGSCLPPRVTATHPSGTTVGVQPRGAARGGLGHSRSASARLVPVRAGVTRPAQPLASLPRPQKPLSLPERAPRVSQLTWGPETAATSLAVGRGCCFF